MSMQTIDQFLGAVGSVKIAAEANTEPGSIGGETSHPVKNVDDRTEKAKEGERSSENAADVKKDQGSASVDSTPEAKAASAIDVAARFAKKAEGGAVQTPGSAADDHLQIGTNVQATGDDPANETGKAKGGKEDPGSSHPARTDNDALDGHKYAYDANTPLEKMANDFKDLGENICAQIAWMSQQGGNQKTAAAATAQANGKPATPPESTKQAGALDPELAAQAGWELAGLLNGTMDKQAADAMVENTVTEIIKTASADADRTAAFFNDYFAQLNKQAEGEGEPPADPSQPPGGEMPPGGAGGGDPAAMMAAMGGGAGADPMGGAGGPPPGAGGGGEDAEAQQLAAVLEQLGITPEELQAAMAAEAGGGAGGGMPPGAGGPPPGAMAGGPPPGAGGPPPGAGGPPPGMEVQGSDKKAVGGEKVANMREYISEIISRSRKK
jgi:hypothetical protein